MELDPDFVLTQCELDRLVRFVEELETKYSIQITREPSVCLTMVRAEDSLEKQEFFLGEALTTECEVAISEVPGYGLCLGEEPQRGYCIAVVDALRHLPEGEPAEVTEFIRVQGERVEQAEKEEFARILSTQVDFKLMEGN